jgi:hypothetical protein
MVMASPRTLGPEHRTVGKTYNNMASVLKEQSKYMAATNAYLKAQSIFITAYGKDHSSVGMTHYNIAEISADQEDFQNALHLYTLYRALFWNTPLISFEDDVRCHAFWFEASTRLINSISLGWPLSHWSTLPIRFKAITHANQP